MALPVKRTITRKDPGNGKRSMQAPARRDKDFIGLTKKVFDILEALSEHPQTPVPLEHITRSVALAKTTVHRLLYSLRTLGYVEQHPDSGGYMLAAKFFDLGRSALPYRRLSSIARPLMDNLTLRTGESCHLGVLEKRLITYIVVVESQNPYRCAAVMGDYSFTHSTALGKCMLAYLPEEEIEETVREHGLPKIARNTITNYTRLLQELARVREEGCATNVEENIDGVICIAAPIFDGTGLPIAALSVSGPAIRMELIRDAVTQEVKRVAFRLSTMLGYTEDGAATPAISASGPLRARRRPSERPEQP
jgi:DNA-binding IclR family transcriptional regulator